MNIDTIIPSFHSPDLTEACIRSFNKFKPAVWNIRHIVVENSNDTSYQERIERLGSVLWIQNPTDKTEAAANARAVEVGMKAVIAPWVMILHCDTVVCSSMFFTAMEAKMNDGYLMIGTERYPSSAGENCYHCSGIMVRSDIARQANYDSKKIDACDDLTFFCRNNNIKRTCFRNTFNMPELKMPDNISGFHVDRCVDDAGDVIFLHLGRGIPKTSGSYKKPNRVYLGEWLKHCRGIMG